VFVDFVLNEFFVEVQFVFDVLEFLLFLQLQDLDAVLKLTVVAGRLVQIMT